MEEEGRGRGKVTAITKKSPRAKWNKKKVGRSKRSLRPREKSLVTATFAYSPEKEGGKGYFPFSSTVDGRGKKNHGDQGENRRGTQGKKWRKIEGIFFPKRFASRCRQIGRLRCWGVGAGGVGDVHLSRGIRGIEEGGGRLNGAADSSFARGREIEGGFLSGRKVLRTLSSGRLSISEISHSSSSAGWMFPLLPSPTGIFSCPPSSVPSLLSAVS